MAEGWGGRDPDGRLAAGLAIGGSGVAVVSLLLAAAGGAPYLEADGVNPWIVVFAAGLLTALIAFPFGFEVSLRGRYPDRDRRWEVSLLAWGAVSVGVLIVAFMAGFDTDTLGGAAGLIAAIESAIVVATVVVWLISGG